MSQNDFNLANQGFPSMRSDMNSALQALASNSSGATTPSTTYAYQFWYDSTTNILKMRNAANSAWINIFSFDQGAGSYSLGGYYSLRNVIYLTTGTAATYTPTAGTKAINVTAVGGGGGGGGVDGQGAATGGAAGGGGAGGVVFKFISSVAASYTYTVGALGDNGGAGDFAGSNGGTSTFTGTGVSLSAGGGVGGNGRNAGAGAVRGARGAGGTASGGDLNVVGDSGKDGYANFNISSVGDGGSSPYGSFGVGFGISGGSGGGAGTSASGRGAGGGGGSVVNLSTNHAGGNGAGGLIIVEEFA